MAKGGCNFSELVEFRKKMETLTNNMGEILDICARELAQRLMAKVIKRTPVGRYDGSAYVCTSGLSHGGHYVPGKVGGTLRRGWSQGGKYKIYHSASACMIEISNPVEYASYVEYGHRTANHTGWVPGHFMMTISVEEIQRDAPAILEKKIKKLMEAQLK